MKKAIFLAVLLATASGCSGSDNDGKTVTLGKIPSTVFEALDMCLGSCIKEHCEGTKFVLLPDGTMEVFEPASPTDEICAEKANQAIAATGIISNMLGKLGAAAVPDPGPDKVVGETFGRKDAHPGEGYFWAVEYTQCRAECLDRFRLSASE
jgi:hypothetical protein